MDSYAERYILDNYDAYCLYEIDKDKYIGSCGQDTSWTMDWVLDNEGTLIISGTGYVNNDYSNYYYETYKNIKEKNDGKEKN